MFARKCNFLTDANEYKRITLFNIIQAEVAAGSGYFTDKSDDV